MDKEQILEQLENPGLVPVIRLDSGEKLPKLLDAFLRGGIRAAELTMTIPGALELLRESRKQLGDSLLLGMGTITDRILAKAAVDAGAQFLVSPFPVFDALEEARRAGIPMIMGAFSPMEVNSVYHAGADFIKVFPINVSGINYLKDLKGPLPHVKFFPTGGITLEQIPRIFKLACGCGVGGALVRTDYIRDENWEALMVLAADFVAAARAGRMIK